MQNSPADLTLGFRVKLFLLFDFDRTVPGNSVKDSVRVFIAHVRLSTLALADALGNLVMRQCALYPVFTIPSLRSHPPHN
jgi:hypothetical protein